jgi:hypothetical protein
MSDYYEELKKLGIPMSVDAAMDILYDDGMSVDMAAEMSFAAWKSGKDPESFARHVVKLRKAARGE